MAEEGRKDVEGAASLQLPLGREAGIAAMEKKGGESRPAS